jgi:hypothetical protein
MERYPHKVSGSFDTKVEAEIVLHQLRIHPDLRDIMVDLIGPQEHDQDIHLQPETIRVRKSLVREHVVWGSIGLGLGLGIGLLLVATGYPLFNTSPVYTTLVSALGGLTLGLLFGGMLALRPDQGLWAADVKDELKKGMWIVLVHARNGNQTEEANTILREKSVHQQETL